MARAFIPRSRPRCWPANRVPATAGANRRREEQARRSIYIHVKRSLMTPILVELRCCRDRLELRRPLRDHAADAGAWPCSTASSCTTQAAALAERLRREAGNDPAAQVRLAAATGVVRPPAIRKRETRAETARERCNTRHGSRAEAAWNYCLTDSESERVSCTSIDTRRRATPTRDCSRRAYDVANELKQPRPIAARFAAGRGASSSGKPAARSRRWP